MIDVAACAICGESDLQPFDVLRDGDLSLPYSICLHCGHVFQSRRMSDNELEAYYRREYQELVQRRSSPAHTLAIRWARASWFADFARALRLTVRRHLDFGSAGGEMLYAFQQVLGCRSVGIEKNDELRRAAVESDLRTYADLEEVRENESAFDLITLAHSLEHLPDPVGLLTDLRVNFLTGNGAILLEVPNLFGHASYEIPHLHAFHARSLSNALRQAGYRPESVRAHGSYRSPILDLYLTALARPSGEQPGGLQRASPASVRLQRNLGMLRKRAFTRALPGWTWRDPRAYSRRVNPELMGEPR